MAVMHNASFSLFLSVSHGYISFRYTHTQCLMMACPVDWTCHHQTLTTGKFNYFFLNEGFILEVKSNFEQG